MIIKNSTSYSSNFSTAIVLYTIGFPSPKIIKTDFNFKLMRNNDWTGELRIPPIILGYLYDVVSISNFGEAGLMNKKLK